MERILGENFGEFWVPTNACDYLNNILAEVSGGCTQLCSVIIMQRGHSFSSKYLLRPSVWSALLLYFLL